MSILKLTQKKHAMLIKKSVTSANHVPHIYVSLFHQSHNSRQDFNNEVLPCQILTRFVTNLPVLPTYSFFAKKP